MSTADTELRANAMRNIPTTQRYGAVAQCAHWLTVVLLAGSFSVGLYMAGLSLSPTRLRLFSYHKWIGVTVFAVVVLRLLWRLWVRPPPMPPMAVWQRRSAEITHWLLYLLLLAVPLSGWLMSSAKGFQTVVFGVLPIPDLIDKDRALGDSLERVHWILNKLLLGVVGIHVLAALKHHFVDRDTVLLRMLPRLRKPENP